MVTYIGNCCFPNSLELSSLRPEFYSLLVMNIMRICLDTSLFVVYHPHFYALGYGAINVVIA